MRIVIGSDHAGFPLKSTIVDYLKSLGHDVTDVGSYDPEPVDFPDVAKNVTALIIAGKARQSRTRPARLRYRCRRLDCRQQGKRHSGRGMP
jgi:hypothetical protein